MWALRSAAIIAEGFAACQTAPVDGDWKGWGTPFDTPPFDGLRTSSAAATQGEGEGIGKAFEQQPPHPE